MNKKNIKFVDLQYQYEQYKEEIDVAIARVIENSAFILGNEVALVEKNLASWVGVEHCIACANGTDALILALMALDLSEGDEVITTPFTFIATVEAIALVGAKPVLVDIELDSYNIDHHKIEEKITSKTKAILPVSIFGQTANMAAIKQIAAKHQIPVVEDAAQSFGATFQNIKSCHLSDIATTSFFPAKPLGCYGDGGALFTNDSSYAEKIRLLANHGQGERYKHKIIGTNSRLDGIQAAILDVKLKHFAQEVILRQQVAQKYNEAFAGHSEQIICPQVIEDRTSVFAQYCVRVKNRAEVIKTVGEVGIPVAVHYPIPVYHQEAFQYLNQDPSEFPNTELTCSEICSLPMHPFLSADEQDYIVNHFLRANKC